jgi:hypothetical protein
VVGQAERLALRQSIDHLPDGAYRFSVWVGSRLEFQPWVHPWSSAAMGISRAAFREERVVRMCLSLPTRWTSRHCRSRRVSPRPA